jgi:phosphoserine phosphatase
MQAPWPASVSRALAGPPQPVAFDMDGTLLVGDLGEDVLFARLDAEGPGPALRALLGPDVRAGYRHALAHGPDPVHYAACGLALEGWSTARATAAAAAAFARGAIRPRPAVCALAHAFAAAGHPLWIVTGTATVLARAFAAHAGLPVAGVLGMELAMDGDHFTGTVDGPVLCGAGKIDAWWARGPGVAPAIVLGDTALDLPLMGLATVGAVGVPVRPAAAAAFVAAGVPVVDPDGSLPGGAGAPPFVSGRPHG